MLVAQGGGVTSVGVVAGGGLRGVTGEPYTATRKTTRVQTLANGTEITHETIVKEARDSNGRTYRESHPELPAGAEGEDFVTVNIFDPTNRVNILWNTRSKQATIFHMPDPAQLRPPTGTEIPQTQPMVQPLRNAPSPAPQIENLGIQTINGVAAQGSRVTRIIPAGRQGNDQPITITSETWRSTELKLVIRSINNDPRSGVTTIELTDIQQGEPDPALFQVPEGYTVKEQFPQMQNQ
jgi:hypothetical protein